MSNQEIGIHEEEKKLDPMGYLNDYVTDALKKDDLDKHINTVIAVLTASDWKVKMLRDPGNKQDLVTALKEPWLYFEKKGKMPFEMETLIPKQAGQLWNAAGVIANSLVGFSQLAEEDIDNHRKNASSPTGHGYTGSQGDVSVPAYPTGPEIDVYSVGAIIEFLSKHMLDSLKFSSVPHVLGKTSLSFALSGRDSALEKAASAFRVFLKPVEETDRSQRKIPVCSGLSGLGKTRMLEEWERIFDIAAIPGTRFGALVLYYNGHMPQAVEKSMTIEASFSWRLLHRLFIEGNGLSLRDWFRDSLPKNAGNLSLAIALQVIRFHMISLGQLNEEDCLHFFLGIDEYQAIPDVKGRPLTQDEGLLQDLLNVLGDILASPVVGVRLYPMFAGTDLSVISIANSSKTETIRMPMSFLSQSEVENAICAVPRGLLLLRQDPIRRHLFYLGGVPRWTTQYIEKLLLKVVELNVEDGVLDIEDIEQVFRDVKSSYIDEWGKFDHGRMKLQSEDMIRLAAYSLCGISVDLADRPVLGMPWSRIRDSSLCLLDDQSRVSIPYPIYNRISEFNVNNFEDCAMRYFVCTFRSLFAQVDDLLCEKAPWQLWEVFGAHFHSLRINSLIIIGNSEVSVSSLFSGAIINGCKRFVCLQPMLVMETGDIYGEDISEEISVKGHPDRKRNWVEGGWVVINGENGAGVDVFFALKCRDESGCVIITDQRKRKSNLDESVSNLLKKAALIPKAIGDVSVIPSLFSIFTPRTRKLDCEGCLVSYSQTKHYHGSLWLHPAASPVVNVNFDSVSYLQLIFIGDRIERDKICKEILNHRSSRKRKFFEVGEFEEFVEKQKLILNLNHVKLRNDVNERIVF